jgi:hypothetical protein
MDMIPTIETAEASPLIVQPPMRVTGSIFLPMFVSKGGVLHVITLQTYGRPIRYFTDPNDPIIIPYMRYLTGNKQVKKAAPINLGEFYTWEVSYLSTVSNDTYYMNIIDHGTVNNNGHPITSHPIVKIDDLFKLDAPLEFKAAVLNVAFKELGKA